MFDFLKGLFGKDVYTFEICDKKDEDLFRKTLKAIKKYLPSNTPFKVIMDVNDKNVISEKFSFKATDKTFKKMCEMMSKNEKINILSKNKNNWDVMSK